MNASPQYQNRRRGQICYAGDGAVCPEDAKLAQTPTHRADGARNQDDQISPLLACNSDDRLGLIRDLNPFLVREAGCLEVPRKILHPPMPTFDQDGADLPAEDAA